MKKADHLFNAFIYPEPQFQRGVGARLFDENGRDYLDLSSGIAVNCLGHANPYLTRVLKEQAEKLWHVSNLFAVPGREQLASRLCENSFADKVFFTNSGAEAVECAIKTARRYHYNRGAEKRVNILTFEGAFHGRTLATVAAGGNPRYMEGFGLKSPGFVQLPFADEDAVKKAVDERTAGILIEPIMGDDGIREHSRDYLQSLRQICDDNGILLIFDEVQTGMGRTGKLFAYEWSGIEPDIMALAKGLGGGFPVGACLAREEVAVAITPGTHGSTFGGNPLAMAVANAVLDIVLEDGFLDDVNQTAKTFRQYLTELLELYPQLFEEVRGRGLLLGLKCRIANSQVVEAFRDVGVLTPPAGDNVVRLLPPLNINGEELDEAYCRMNRALVTVSKND